MYWHIEPHSAAQTALQPCSPRHKTAQQASLEDQELEPKSAKTSDIKEMLGKSIRIVENTQNAPIDSINENRWNTLMPLQPV